LAAKALETVRLTEALSISPGDEAVQEELGAHLSDLRGSAHELGLVHLEAAVAEAMSRLKKDSFGPGALVVVRVLAWRYETLAAMPSQSGTHRVVQEDAPPPAKVSLRGRRVLVADAEAEVRWSYVGVLREAGARVIEARDGIHALELARGDAPDLVLSAMEMPRLDGLGLCAALRREPALDGIAVILLSGRASAPEVLRRVSRGLEPVTQLEEWLKRDFEASGDLEELGVSGLLRAVRRHRPNATMVLQDPWSLFDLELREGCIVAASRTAIDGAVTRDADAFPPLVGMSSGRFVVAESPGGNREEERPSLDAAFAEATRRLGLFLGMIAKHSDCRVDLDQEVLETYVRHSPIAVQRLIARLVAGEPPNALWESGAGSRGLVDAVLVTLARQGAIRDVYAPTESGGEGPSVEFASRLGPDTEVTDAEFQRSSPPMPEPVERENIRAELSVAMHREPANQGPPWAYPIWRLTPSAAAAGVETDSGFTMELQSRPRLLGLAFVTLWVATVGFLLWGQLTRLAAPEDVRVGVPAPLQAPAADPVAPAQPAAQPAPAPPITGLATFSGRLRPLVDSSLGVADGEGVLELVGQPQVSVTVDGVERGTLPLRLVLEEGVHAVRYRVGTKRIDRFYYVKSGSTRGTRVITRAGALIDAR
jgi:CheY-like chemotaxis protein